MVAKEAVGSAIDLGCCAVKLLAVPWGLKVELHQRISVQLTAFLSLVWDNNNNNHSL
jgi:hypothetical protein